MNNYYMFKKVACRNYSTRLGNRQRGNGVIETRNTVREIKSVVGEIIN